MGVYLNSRTAYTLYKKETEQPYFVDKTQMLQELFPLVKQGNNQICITRPRRFGKTVMANMISSFFSKGCDAGDIFRKLQISKIDEYEQYQNQYSVIHISFNKLPRQCDSYREYINRIERILIKDLKEAYPEVEVDETEAEVSGLFKRYMKICKDPGITQEGLRVWYNGYHTAAGERVYNPRSVVLALQYNHLENYWTSSGPYDEIFYYIEHNVDDVRDDLALMVSGASVSAKIQEYAATSMNLQTKDEIFSAMVVYGFLSYENGKVSIPNQELIEVLRDAE